MLDVRHQLYRDWDNALLSLRSVGRLLAAIRASSAGVQSLRPCRASALGLAIVALLCAAFARHFLGYFALQRSDVREISWCPLFCPLFLRMYSLTILLELPLVRPGDAGVPHWRPPRGPSFRQGRQVHLNSGNSGPHSMSAVAGRRCFRHCRRLSACSRNTCYLNSGARQAFLSFHIALRTCFYGSFTRTFPPADCVLVVVRA